MVFIFMPISLNDLKKNYTSVGPGTPQLIFTGMPGKTFRVTMKVSSVQQNSTYTLLYFVSYQGSTAIFNTRSLRTGAAGAGGTTITISDDTDAIVTMGLNSSLQLGSSCTPALTIAHPTVQYIVTEV